MITVLAEFVVGLALVYLMLSVLVVALVEYWAQITASRGRMLRRGIAALVGETGPGAFTEAFYHHPLIKSLRHGSRLPAYIPGHTYTLALFDLLVNGRDPSVMDRQSVQSVSQLVNAARDRPSLFPSALLQQLAVLLELACDYEEALLIVEHWFDDTMDRVKGWYKRRTQIVILIVGFGVALLANADTLLLANHLLKVESDGRILGWSCVQECTVDDVSAVQPVDDVKFWGLKLVGVLLTALVLTISAPLVFDVLVRIMQVRATGVWRG